MMGFLNPSTFFGLVSFMAKWQPKGRKYINPDKMSVDWLESTNGLA